MNIDIITSILYRNTDIKSKEFISIKQNKLYNEMFNDNALSSNDNNKNKKYLPKNLFYDYIKETEDKMSEEKSMKTKSKDINTIEEKRNIKEKIRIKNQEINIIDRQKISKINNFSILKSYLCFKDKKIDFIRLCDKIMEDELCIDKIIVRLFTLEKMYNLLPDEDKAKIQFMETEKMLEIHKKLENWDEPIYTNYSTG